MKQRKLPLLAALPAAVFAANVSAGTDVTVYGKVNVSLEQQQQSAAGIDTQDTWKLMSNASRLGFKGKTDLGDSGLAAVYKLEYETNVDGDTNGQEFKQRNIYGGLQGGFGTAIAGKFDTPTKKAQGKIDLFNDQTLGDIKNYLSGENRENNLIQYSSPKIAEGMQINVAIQPGEENGALNNNANDGIADGVSASLTYDNDMMWLAVSVDDSIDMTDMWRLVGQFKVGDWALGAMYQSAEESETGMGIGGGIFDEEDGWMLSAKWATGPHAVKLQYGYSERQAIGTNIETETDNYAIGYDFKLAKGTKLYTYYADQSAEVAGAASVDDDVLSFGFEHKF